MRGIFLEAGFFRGIIDGFYEAVIAANRWQFYLSGLGRSLIMVAMAGVIGIVLGTFLAIFKVSNAGLPPFRPRSGKGLPTGRAVSPSLPQSASGQAFRPSLTTVLGRWLVRFLGWFANVYTTVIRGTPVLLQMLIIYSVIFATAAKSWSLYIAALAFGINSGAYVCEIIRAGIQSVDRGQTEAGRSLGLGQGQTMRLIIIPQAIKNILPTLFNELISLLKETSVAGYIGIVEITRAGDIVRSRLWNFYPLFMSALLYLGLVLIMTRIQQGIERRLQASDRRP